MKSIRFFLVLLCLIQSSVGFAQEKSAFGQWRPMFRDGQLFVGDTTIKAGKIIFDNKLVLRIGAPSVVIPAYKWYTTTVRAVAYPVYGDATHTILRNAYPLCRPGRQPKWIVISVTPEKNENRNDLSITLSLTNPAHPTDPNTPNFAEKICTQITYIPGTMAQMDAFTKAELDSGK